MDKPIRIITHNGTFHVDELLAVAAIEIYLDGKPYDVIRTRDPELIRTGDYVVDVGMVCDPDHNRFDHHQHGGAGTREHNGIPYSSFGLVWKKLGEAICESKEVAEGIERRLAYPVDLADSGFEAYTPAVPGVHPYLLHNLVIAYRPTWKEGEVQDMRFMELIPFMKRLIEREIVVERDKLEGVRLVRESYEKAEDKRIIVLEGQYPWQEELSKYPEPLYIVKPKHQGPNWEVECVRDDVLSFTNRKSLPESWAGQFNGELAKISGVPDAEFCHNMRWIAVAKSRAGALRLAELARDAAVAEPVSHKLPLTTVPTAV